MHQLSVSIAECYKRGGKVLICGNGGLAAESEHFCAELMGKYGRDIFIPCIALTCNSSLITAISNDMGFDRVFAHQVKTLGKQGDVVIAMTTSASTNVLRALGEAAMAGMFPAHICRGGYHVPSLFTRFTIDGDTVAEVQNNIIKFLHEVALEAKELCVEEMPKVR
jgi:D-sedoheptulose 7-phosphate isomerase